MTVTAINERTESMGRHPAGKKRAEAAEVVYSTTTGEEPRGSVTLTEEATAPLPPPEKLIRKATVKKRRPRVVAKAARLDLHITVDPMVMAAAKSARRPGEKLVIVSATEVRLVAR